MALKVEKYKMRLASLNPLLFKVYDKLNVEKSLKLRLQARTRI